MYEATNSEQSDYRGFSPYANFITANFITAVYQNLLKSGLCDFMGYWAPRGPRCAACGSGTGAGARPGSR